MFSPILFPNLNNYIAIILSSCLNNVPLCVWIFFSLIVFFFFYFSSVQKVLFLSQFPFSQADFHHYTVDEGVWKSNSQQSKGFDHLTSHYGRFPETDNVNWRIKFVYPFLLFLSSLQKTYNWDKDYAGISEDCYVSLFGILYVYIFL